MATSISILILVRVVAPVPFGPKGRSSTFMFSNSSREIEKITTDIEKIDVLHELCCELRDVEHIRVIKTARMGLATFFTVIVLLGYAIQISLAIGF